MENHYFKKCKSFMDSSQKKRRKENDIIYSKSELPSSCCKPVKIYFLVLRAIEDILKNVGNPTVAGSHWLP